MKKKQYTIFQTQDPTKERRQRGSLGGDGYKTGSETKLESGQARLWLVGMCQQSISEKNKLRRYPEH